MAKDPAFLFYSSDFLSGTMFMTNEQVGMYIRLLCAQHQHGRLMPSQCQVICHGIPDPIVMAKFQTDERGMIYNERIEKEISKRSDYAKKQSERAKKRWQCRGNAFLENRNRIVIENKDIDKGGVGEKKFNPNISKELLELYSSESIWLQQVTMKIQVTMPERTIELLRRFLDHQALSNNLEGRTDKEIKSHFLNWVNANPKEKEDVIKKIKQVINGW